MTDDARADKPGRTGVLIIGFGGPDSIEAVRPFMCELTGREPSDETVDEVCRRYLAIGGESPLLEIANSMAAALADRAGDEDRRADPVAVGMRYSAPSIRSAVSRFVEEGVERIVICSLSPFESKVTHDAYREAVAEAAGRTRPRGCRRTAADRLDAGVRRIGGGVGAVWRLQQLEPPDGALVVFTAHSLPLSDLVDGRSLCGRSEVRSRPRVRVPALGTRA